MLELQNIGFLEFIKSTYPTAFIVIILAGFGSSLAGFARRAYFKNQDRIISSLERELEKLSQ